MKTLQDIREGFFTNVGADKYTCLKDLYNRMYLYLLFQHTPRAGSYDKAKWKEGALYFITIMTKCVGDIHINITEDWEKGWEELYKSIISNPEMKNEKTIPINITVARKTYDGTYMKLYISGPEDRPTLVYNIDKKGNTVFNKVMRND